MTSSNILRWCARTGLIAAFCLAGCSPTYNWRDVVGEDGAYVAQFPAKPSSLTRHLRIGGVELDMQMTAAQADGVTFAVGTAKLPDAAQARALLGPLRQALIENLGAHDGTVKPSTGAALDIDVQGTYLGKPVRMLGRVQARGARIYQIVVLGQVDAVPPEHIEQFLTSFEAR